MAGRIVRKIVYPVPQEWIHDITGETDNLNALIFRMFSKADRSNFWRLATGFPVQAAAFLMWQAHPEGKLPIQVELEIRDELRWAFIPGSPVIGL